jgi:hypothetical protein
MHLITDKDCKVAGVYQPPKRRNNATLPQTFEAVLKGSIMRLQLASIRPSYHKQKTLPGFIANNSTETSSPQDIVGTLMDGTVVILNILEEKTWRLLRFVQNMCLRNDLILPFSSASEEARREPIEPIRKNTTKMHIDGDLLARLLALPHFRCEEELTSMLTREPDGSEERWGEKQREDFQTAGERVKRFEQLVEEVLQGTEWYDYPKGGGNENREMRDEKTNSVESSVAVRSFIRYLREALKGSMFVEENTWDFCLTITSPYTLLNEYYTCISGGLESIVVY